MGQQTGIAWTHHTFNAWWGCTRVSPGCENCYAETFSKRVGLAVWGPKAERRLFPDRHWDEPLKWHRMAEKAGERRRVFCSSMADVFEDRRDLEELRARLWRLIERTPWLDWLLLTKRPENHEMVPLAWQTGSRRPPNVWLGCTAEDQAYAERRLPELLRASWPAVRFVSYEPALGPVTFPPGVLGVPGHLAETFGNPLVHWVIVGGESGGRRARLFDAAWARSTIEQCQEAGAACFVKQLGSNAIDSAYGVAPLELRDPKGGDWAEWREDLRVREFPARFPMHVGSAPAKTTNIKENR